MRKEAVMYDYNKLKMKLIDAGIESEEIAGCTTDEMNQYESTVGQKLPMEYRRFLEVMGRSAGVFLEDLDAFYPGVLSATKRVRAVAAEMDEPIPDDAIVIAHNRAESYVFVRASDGDDPPVYGKVNDGNTWHIIYPSLAEFFEDQINSV
jgi:hypothetical protein